MNKKSVFRKTLLAATIATLTACSGGGDDSATTADASTTSGVITGFGSIFINGVEYETDTASIDIDGAALPETQLGVGDVCVIEGTVDADGINGTAVSVKCADELEGYVLDVTNLAVDGTGTIIVMGQTVNITLDTVFEGNGIDILTINDLTANDVVEVSGFSDGSGTILATRIETKEANDDVEVKGLVSALDTNAMTFVIGDLLVNYSAAGEFPEALADGLLVEVETETALRTDELGGYIMDASQVEVEEDGDMKIDGDEGEEIKMQGLVSGVDLEAGTFLFNGQSVDIASLDDDFDSSALMDGSMMTVEGYINAAGNFVVEEIEDEKETEDSVEGTVTAFTETTVTVTDADGIETTLTVNNDTRMMDDRGDSPSMYFSLGNVVEGDVVEVEFYTDDNGDKFATELERKDAEVEEEPVELVEAAPSTSV